MSLCVGLYQFLRTYLLTYSNHYVQLFASNCDSLLFGPGQGVCEWMNQCVFIVVDEGRKT